MKKNILLKSFILSIMFLILASPFSGQAMANTLTLDLGKVFSGATPGGTAPWLRVVLDDAIAATGWQVRLTMTALNLVSNEFVSDWYLNLNPNINSTSLVFDKVNVLASDPTISKGTDAYKADGDGYFDVKFAFPTSGQNGGSGKFTAGESVVYDIKSTTGTLTASSFNFLSVGGDKGGFKSAAHIQGVGSSSAWVGVAPEPISSALFLIGSGALAGLRLRKRK